MDYLTANFPLYFILKYWQFMFYMFGKMRMSYVYWFITQFRNCPTFCLGQNYPCIYINVLVIAWTMPRLPGHGIFTPYPQLLCIGQLQSSHVAELLDSHHERIIFFSSWNLSDMHEVTVTTTSLPSRPIAFTYFFPLYCRPFLPYRDNLKVLFIQPVYNKVWSSPSWNREFVISICLPMT